MDALERAAEVELVREPEQIGHLADPEAVIDEQFESVLHPDPLDIPMGGRLRVTLEEATEMFGCHPYSFCGFGDARCLDGMVQHPSLCFPESPLRARKVGSGPVGHRTEFEEEQSESAGADLLGEGVIGFGVSVETLEEVRDFCGFCNASGDAIREAGFFEKRSGLVTDEIHVIFQHAR